MFKYSVSVKWSDEDEGFIATVPELEGLSSFGETQEEAVNELMVAAEAFMETLKESSQPIPKPDTVTVYSGQLRLRLPKSLHGQLAAGAEKEGVSLNTYLVSLLSQRQGAKEVADAIKEELVQAFRVTSYVQKKQSTTKYFELFRSASRFGGRDSYYERRQN